MPLTKKEQEKFEKMFTDMLDVEGLSDKHFVERLSDVLFGLTGDVNHAQRLKVIAGKL
ncbi:hypothetical protein LCGC14_1052960 [marine sediment metagenome]|uniref:Uncharacterized protein n=1 Tax=marine sediment metagenome TaxID=412755 RepID=A0A0F9MST9_9ZZZZ